MLKENIKKLLVVLFVLGVLVSCKPSDKYAGEWFAVSASGLEVMIDFSKEKTITFLDGEGNEEVYDLNQTVSGIQNSTRYFKIEIDGASHYVVFENSKDEDNAKLVRQTNHASDFEDVVGDVIYQMNRNDFPH